MLGLRRTALAALAVLGFVTMAQAETKTVTGKVGYLERMALPPGAVMDVRLLDVSKQDVAATTISAQRFAMTGIPQDFTLSYDSAVIDPKLSYSVRADILLDGNVLFRTTQAYPVLTNGAPDYVELTLQRAQTTAAAPDLTGTDWVVQEVGGRMLVAKNPPTIAFPSPGRVAIFGGCNRYTGAATPKNGELEFPDALAGTMMACPPEQTELERTVIDTLEQVTSYVVAGGGGLSLTNDAGIAVMRLIPAS